MIVIANELRKVRKERKLSQIRLARLAGVSLNVVKAIEGGKSTVTVKSLEKILSLFGLELTIQGKKSENS